MELHSGAFGPGARIPERYTCDGEDLSPPLSWSGVPTGASSLVLLCDDPDAPAGTWRHWAVYDISPDVADLPEALPAEAGGLRQAINDFGRHGYGGPCPPRSHGTHHYRFRLLALDVPTLGLGDGARCADVERASRRHVLAEAVLIGTCAR